jgi:NADH dehydrogenase
MPYVRLVLVEGSGNLLNGMPVRLGQLAERRLKKMGVEVVFNFRVKAVTDHSIESADGRSIESENIFWVAGIKPNALIQNLDLAKSKDGRIIVDPYFEAIGRPGVYAIGDCAYLLQPGSDRPYPSTAQSATKMGIACGRNIACKINGEARAIQFNYKHRNDIVFLGRNYAVGEFWGITVGNSAAFVIYVVYHLIKLTGFKSKLTTSVNWFYAYFSGRNTSRI